MTDTSYRSFRDIAAGIFSRRNEDPVLHILVLTYEFDDQQLQNLVCGNDLETDFELRQAQLKVLCDIRPVVIYDSRKTPEAPKLPQFLELHPWKSGAWSCHHSKAYMVVTAARVHLVLGSFNLTFTGLFRNREVFDYFCWGSAESDEIPQPDTHLLREWTDFLKNFCLVRMRESSHSALRPIVDALDRRLSAMPALATSATEHLVVSGYLEAGAASRLAGLDQLEQRWVEFFPGESPFAALAVSPFFDLQPGAANGGFAEALKSRFPSIEQLSMVTSEAAAKDLSKEHFGGVRHGELFLVPELVSDKERKSLVADSPGQGNSMQGVEIRRKLHAKLLVLQGKSGSMVYLGSANFSIKAWMGANFELGFVRRVNQTNDLREAILHGIGAMPDDRFAMLPEATPVALAPQTDDEEYSTDGHSPGFIEMVSLQPGAEPEHFRFVFELVAAGNGLDAGNFDDYEISWADIHLHTGRTVDSVVLSQDLAKREFRRLLVGGRNLCLRHREHREHPYYLPFQYHGELIAERESFVHPTSWDWMSYYLNSTLGTAGIGTPGEFVPGEAMGEDTATGTGFAVEREKNLVIAMQAYLSQFSRVEREFLARRGRINLLPADRRVEELRGQVAEPLAALSRILLREAPVDSVRSAGGLESSAFKLGELLLLARRLAKGLTAHEAALFDAWTLPVAALLRGWAGSSNCPSTASTKDRLEAGLLGDYVGFVLAGEER